MVTAQARRIGYCVKEPVFLVEIRFRGPVVLILEELPGAGGHLDGRAVAQRHHHHVFPALLFLDAQDAAYGPVHPAAFFIVVDEHHLGPDL